MANAFTRSWDIMKMTMQVIKADKELLLFPIVGGVFSIIFVVLMVLPTLMTAVASGISQNFAFQAPLMITIFIIYFGLAFIATFFNVCVVYTTKTRFSGNNATFMESLKFAFSKIHLIAAWSLLAATVGIILRLLDNIAERMGFIGEIVMRIIIGLLGAAWSIITIFVVPAMVYKDLGPVDAIKKSITTFKKTWGESIIRYLGLGILQAVLLVISLIVFLMLFFMSIPTGIGMIIVALLAIAYFVMFISFFSVANTVFNTALYVYADTGKVPKGFSQEAMKNAFQPKKKR